MGLREMLANPSEQRWTVPRDFVIDDRSFEFTVRQYTPEYSSPSSQAGIFTTLGVGVGGGAICRVKVPSGEWWLVAHNHSALTYVPEANVSAVVTP
jgi:hypothetical protein